MEKYRIIWSPEAKQELDNIHFYIEHYLKEKRLADNMVKKLLIEISNLDYFPEKFERMKMTTNRVENARKMLVNNYVVIYEIKKDTRSSIYSTYFSFKSKLF